METKKNHLLELIDRYNSPDIYDDNILLPTVKQNANGQYVDMTTEEREQYRLDRIKLLQARYDEFISSLKNVGHKWHAVYGHYGKTDVLIEEVNLTDCLETDNSLMHAYTPYDRETGLQKGDIWFYNKDELFDTRDEAMAYVRTRALREMECVREKIDKYTKRLQWLENALVSQ